MKNKPAEICGRNAKMIDAITVASNPDAMLACTCSYHAEPNAKAFKQMRMYIQVLINKLEKEFPQYPAVFFP
jgi:hypothetical protein